VHENTRSILSSELLKEPHESSLHADKFRFCVGERKSERVRAKSSVYVHAKNNTKQHCEQRTKGRVNKTQRREMKNTLNIWNYCANHKRITRTKEYPTSCGVYGGVSWGCTLSSSRNFLNALLVNCTPLSVIITCGTPYLT